MTPEAFRTSRDRLGLTQQALAELLGVNVRQVQRWESGENHPPAYLSRALIDLERERQEVL